MPIGADGVSGSRPTSSARPCFGSSPATYRSIADTHVNHLVDLGINVVQLMPITEFPTDWSGGYNPISQFAVEWKSGDVDDFKYMIDQFHQAGVEIMSPDYTALRRGNRAAIPAAEAD